MVQPRPRHTRPRHLQRAMRQYIRARFKAGIARAAIAKIAQIARDHPGEEKHAADFLPRWVRQMALDGVAPPEPDMWAFYWRGKGQKNQGGPPT